MLAPTLRRHEGLLARTLGLGRTGIPPWLAELQAEGSIEAGSVWLGELPGEKLRARLRWGAAQLEIHDLEARLGGGSLRGKLNIDLSRAEPSYRLAAQLRGIAWSAGYWEAEGSLQSQGTGLDLWRNLHAEGSFSGRGARLGPEAEVRTVSGSLQLSVVRGAPRLRLSGLEADLGEEVLRGQGATQDDGRLHLLLSDGRRTVRATATLVPFQLTWQRP